MKPLCIDLFCGLGGWTEGFLAEGVHLTSPAENHDAVKIGGDWFSDSNSTCRKHGSKSNARKAASAMIAKIPFPLARYVAQSFHPNRKESAA